MLNSPEGIQLRDHVSSRTEPLYLARLSPPANRVISALLPSLPGPDESIRALQRLLEEAHSGALEIADDPITLRYALTIFSHSRFLTDAIIRFPGWLLDITRAHDLYRGFLSEQYEQLLQDSLPPDGIPKAVDLALFRRRQLLRIVLRDVLRFADLSETTEDLSNLADAILNVTWRAVRREVARERGISDADARDGKFSILALGKLGGRELNYSSDIDLMFVHSGGDPEFFRVAANRMTDLLSSYTPEGMCYRVDLRLRPDGRYGELCQSLEGAKQYYASRGRDWELQMLIKARVAAGDDAPGRDLLEFVQPFIYRTTTDFSAVEAVSETRARIHERQKRVRSTGVNVKLERGGIRDIEFLVQCLQRLHGGLHSWVRHGGTLMGLSRLRDKDLLSPSEYARLVSAYQFLRHLEHRLQCDEDLQTHTLPASQEELDLLARRMPAGTPGLPSAGTLERELDHHFTSVQDLYDRVIHSQLASSSSAPGASEDVQPAEPVADSQASEPEHAEVLPGRADFPSANLSRYLDQRAPALSQLLAGSGLYRSTDSFESFLEKLVAQPDWLDIMDRDTELARCTIDVFEHSQYFADQLVRHTELLEEVRLACGERQGRVGFHAPREQNALRRYFRAQMVRIQSDSVYHRVPVFRTLERTSELAQSVIEAAYEIARDETLILNPPAGSSYSPRNQMMVIALGRLGTLEFDLASDADLVFAIPDADAAETVFWTRVAERMIHTIGAYTGDGVVFTIDTRLRPNGREGALVQTESACKEYFEHHAEAWEGISWMKARGVAGDLKRATDFLGQLQEVDWRRYGQNGRSRAELARMRVKLEREQGGRNPLKAGPGGYYDIDFALMYLRLRGAGFFFTVLNTPKRIETVEKMGLLERDEAQLLLDAATFYRAVDHGLRIATGHAEGSLPSNRSEAAVLTELVHRWTPPALHEGSLHSVSKRIRRETRDYFERLFGKPV